MVYVQGVEYVCLACRTSYRALMTSNDLSQVITAAGPERASIVRAQVYAGRRFVCARYSYDVLGRYVSRGTERDWGLRSGRNVRTVVSWSPQLVSDACVSV
jgi:hypothetical protein